MVFLIPPFEAGMASELTSCQYCANKNPVQILRFLCEVAEGSLMIQQVQHCPSTPKYWVSAARLITLGLGRHQIGSASIAVEATKLYSKRAGFGVAVVKSVS